MSEALQRREFLGAAALTGLSVSLLSGAEAPSNQINVAVIGTGGRGTALSKTFGGLPGVNITHVCDVDARRMNNAAGEVERLTKKAPKLEGDFRKVLEDKSVDAVIVATCNHWHAPIAIMACAHGKHVYVEKPCSHNPLEGEMMVQAARKYKKQVQMGNQRRSWDKIIEAMQMLRDGVIGRVYLAHAWYTNNRPTIGKGEAKDPPKELNYDLWQGPAPRMAFRTNYLHYNWHWFWNWGNGELGNNGVHMIDLCRWGLGVDYPIGVSSSGGRYRYQDDQQTPDTHTVSFDFEGGKSIVWQGFSCNQLPGGTPADVIFFGEKGTLTLRDRDRGWTIYDPKGKEIKKCEAGKAADSIHVGNFLDAIRGNAKLNSEIEEAHKSTLLCHLGNIAYRKGRSLKCSSKDGKILNDAEAMALWTREYEKGWEPKLS